MGPPDGTEPVDIEHLISMLFREAQENGAFDYTLALLRVGGIESGKDPLLTVREETADDVAALATDELRAWYCLLAQLEDPLSLIANLLRCSSKQTFTPFPFSPLITGTFPDLHRPDQSEKVAFVTKLATDLQAPGIAALLTACYPEALLAVCENKDAEIPEETLRAAVPVPVYWTSGRLNQAAFLVSA